MTGGAVLSSLPSLYPLSRPKPIMPAGFIHLKPIFHVVYMGDTQMVSNATEKNKAVKGESIREGAAGLKNPSKIQRWQGQLLSCLQEKHQGRGKSETKTKLLLRLKILPGLVWLRKWSIQEESQQEHGFSADRGFEKRPGVWVEGPAQADCGRLSPEDMPTGQWLWGGGKAMGQWEGQGWRLTPGGWSGGR